MPTDSVRDQLQSALTGRYAIERELGRGGMATVYLARDLRHDRLVALKLLNPELGAVLGAERFLSEIRVTANLQHPNLLPLFDSGEADGLLFYVMPYVEGESLRHRIERERQLPVDDAVRIAIAIANALDYAHRRGIIHRDLKPENILLHEGQPLVADFGIALAVSNAGGQRVTQTGLSLGTPQYMSPEQASGDRVIDGRTDIYSLGAVAYEMLAGEPPHTGATPQAIMARLMTEEPRALTAVRRAVPLHVEAAIHRALEKLPADRFATGADLAHAIEGVGRNTFTATQLRGTPVAVRRWKIATAVTSVVAVAALVGLATMRKGSESRAKPVRVRFPLELPDSARMNREPGSSALSMDGTMLAYVTREPSAAVYVRPLDELTPRRIAGTEGAANPEFSPDGRWIGFSVRNSLMKVPVDGGTSALIADSVSEPSFAWLDGGTIVFTRIGRDGRQALWKVSDAGGAAVPLTTVAAEEQRHRFPVRLPGGKAAVFAIQIGAGVTAPQELATVRLSDGKVTRLGLTGSFPKYADGLLFFVRPDFTFVVVPFDAARARMTGEPMTVAGSGTGDVAENGTMIMYPNASAMELMSVDRRGTARPLLGLSRAYHHPRLSPDGRRLAVGIGAQTLENEIWVIDLGSETPTKLSTDGGGVVNEWTPDGRRILWTRGGGAPAVWSQPWDGSAPAEIVLAGAQGAQLFPGAREFLTTFARPDGAREVRIVPLPVDTLQWSKPLPLRRAPGFATPRPSPDGKWIAYVDQQSGVSEVFVYARAGGHYQVSVGGGIEPVWNPVGNELFYRAPQGALMSAHLELGAEARVVKRDTLFSFGFAPGRIQANYDVTADGQHFIIPRPIVVSERPIVVIGWTEELREQMRAGRTPR